LANYLYNFATLLNKFYHESPVIQEKDEKVKNFRLALIARAKDTLKTGLNLLGIEALDEM
jgi:arginyl-tRNA synthetase